METELSVQAAIEELMAGAATIVIAHRLATIRGAYARLAAVAEGTATA